MNFKKNIFFVFYSVVLFIFLIAGFLRINVSEVKAEPSPVPVGGYAWSDTIGWIEFDPSFGGVFYDLTTKKLSGYAWSDNIGWIKFDGLSSYPDSLRGSVAVSDTNGFVSGWARACAGTVKGDCTTMESRLDGWDGWDGWISLSRKPSGSGADYGVKIDLVSSSQTYGDFSGYAWGSDVVGWIKFNCQDTPGECAQSNYKIRASLPGVPLEVSCSANPSSVSLSEAVSFTAKTSGGTAPYSYVWTGDDGLSGTTETINKSYLTIGTKNATIEVKDAKGVVKISNCSVSIFGPATYRNDPLSAQKTINETQKFDALYKDKNGVETNVSSLASWAIEGLSSVATVMKDSGLAICKNIGEVNIKSVYIDADKNANSAFSSLKCVDPTIGVCGNNINECDGGRFVDVADGTTKYLWQCVGTKSTAACSIDKLTVTAKIETSRFYAKKGETAIIKWSSANATSCVPSNGDSGWKSVGSGVSGDYETIPFSFFPITYTVTCTNGLNSATDSVTINEVFEPATYNISPSGGIIEVKKTFQFKGLYDSDDVTDLAEWISSNKFFVDETGVSAGEFECIKETEASKPITITSNYIDENDVNFTDTAELSCYIVDGKCGTTENECLFGDLDDIEDSNTHYKWECVGSGLTDSCSIKKTPSKLTVAVVGNGMNTGGVVKDKVKDSNNISCTSDCVDYYNNEDVTLEATPKNGYLFSKWEGCDEDNDNQCIVTMGDDDREVVATFIKESDIEITANDITATIVAGLTTNSYYDKTKENLSITKGDSNCDGSSFNLSADINSADEIGDVNVIDFNDSEKKVVSLENSRSVEVPFKGNLVVKNIPGKTLEGKYEIKITATCTDADTGNEIGNTATIYLIIKKILSEWQEN